LLALTWLGFKGGIEQWPQANSLTRRIQTAGQFGYGLLSVLMLISMTSGWRIARRVALSWLVCLTVAGGLAPVAWGDTGWGPSVVAALASAAVGGFIWWLLERATKRPRCWVRYRWDLTQLPVSLSPPATYNFRLATPAEAARLTEVVLAAYAAEPAWAPQLSTIAERMTQRIRETIGQANAAYLVVEQNDVVVGVSGVAETHWTDQQLLTGICVLPAHQRRGLGTFLLGESLRWLRERGLAQAQVYTEKDSMADRRLYSRFGSRREVGVEYPGAHSLMRAVQPGNSC
jgi:ribosomal protein S18 acetylase RimI-like enzyme